MWHPQTTRGVAALLAGLQATACATGMRGTRLGGAQVVVHVEPAGTPHAALQVKGELLAVGPQKVVVIDGDVREIPRADVGRVDVVRRRNGGRIAALLTLCGTVLSAVALSSACQSAKADSDLCGRVGWQSAALWVAIGGLSTADLVRSATERVPAKRLDELRSVARFPQGLPPGATSEELLPAVGTKQPATLPRAAAHEPHKQR